MEKLDKVRLFEGITCIDPALVEEADRPPRKKPVPVVWLRRAGALAASFVFAVAVLLSLNAAFPAFAESLPLVGPVFQRLNALGSHASTYEGLVRTVGASGENDQYKVTVTEAYCDGEYIFFTMRLDAKEPRLLKMASFETAETQDNPGWSIEIDGESSGLNYTLLSFSRKGYYFESEPVRIKLPRRAGNGETLAVSAKIGSLAGHTPEAMDGAGQIVSNEPVFLHFELTADTSRSLEAQASSPAVDGLTLTSWSSSPSKFTVTLSYPYFDAAGVNARARTEDGTDLGYDLRESGDFSDGEYAPGDTAVQQCSFAGPPEGTKRVIVTVCNERPGEQPDPQSVFGEFTIDLETGEVKATTNYLDEGFQHLPIN